MFYLLVYFYALSYLKYLFLFRLQGGLVERAFASLSYRNNKETIDGDIIIQNIIILMCLFETMRAGYSFYFNLNTK